MLLLNLLFGDIVKLMNKLKLKSLIVFVCVVALLSQPLFFSFMGLLGIEYEGIDSSPVYVIFIVTSFVFVFLAFAYSIFKKGLVK